LKVIKDGEIHLGIQRIKINENGFISIGGMPYYPAPMTIEAETHTGFFALENLEPMFKHMKCWVTRDGEECAVCPVKHNGTCGIMGIKDAAEKEAVEKGNADA
jgi:hypothetical protein